MKSVLLLLFTCTCTTFCSLQAQVGAANKVAGKDIDHEIKLGEDEPGCKDSALLSRIPGCSIIQCDVKAEAEGIEIQVGATQDGAPQKEAMDGSVETLYYLCPNRVTVGQITKVSESALGKSGYKIVYFGRDGEDFPAVTGLKDTQWVQITTYMYNDYSAYVQTAIKVPPELQANADAMAEEMAKNGRVVLTGIVFEKDESDLSAESEKLLADIAAFLVRQPDWRIRVEGHTEGGRDKALSLTLSQKRASSVATWLLEHGIDKSRLSILGLGDGKPIADNSTADGRMKNRRIELVKF